MILLLHVLLLFIMFVNSIPRPKNPPRAGPGQESVWDYPRPAIQQDVSKKLQVVLGGRVIAETIKGKRVLETSHPPTYYFPESDVDLSVIHKNDRKTFCEWKGWCCYYDVTSSTGKVIPNGAWRFFDPSSDFITMKDYYGFYAPQMDACYVDGEKVTPQPGEYYAGWITSAILGPFKGEPGTMYW